MTDEIKTPGAADPESGNTEADSNTANNLLDIGFSEFTGIEQFASTFQKEIYKNIPDDFPQTINLSDAGEILNALEVKINCIDLSQQWIKFYADYRDKSALYPQGTAMAKLEQAKDMLKSSIFSMTDLVQSYDFQRIATLLPDISDWINPRCQYFALSDLLFITQEESARDLLPDIAVEIENLKQQSEYKNLTFAEFIRAAGEQHSLFAQIFENSPLKEDSEPAQQETQPEQQEIAVFKKLDDFPSPRDGFSSLRSIRLEKKVMPNNPLINSLQNKLAINAGNFDMTIANGRGKRREVTIVVNVEYDENEAGIKLTMPNMSEYERQVSDAVCSLWLYGDKRHIMTAEMIYRAMTGQGSDYKATSGQKSAITRFMRKWENIKVTIDLSAEAKMRGLTLEGNLINIAGKKIRYLKFDELFVKAGNTTVSAWQLTEEPISLTYSLLNNQLLTVPLNIYDIKETTADGEILNKNVRNNEARIAVKGNLIRRIAILKGKKHNKQNWSDNIAFDTVFAETGLANMSRDKRSDIMNYIRQCLDYWKAKKYIIDYKLKTKGKAVTGVQIILEDHSDPVIMTTRPRNNDDTTP